MKVKYFIIIQSLLSLFSFSQDIDQNKGWYVGPNISYGVYDGFYYENKFYNITNLFNTYYSYSAGLDAMYAFGRKHILTFGAHYHELRNSPSPMLINNTSGRYVAKELLLPVHMDFCLLKGKVSPYLITGLIPQFLLSAKEIHKTSYYNGTVNESEGLGLYSRFNLYWQFGLGLDVNLKKSKLRIFVYNSSLYPPYFRYLDGLGKGQQVSIHAGISYYLKTSHH